MSWMKESIMMTKGVGKDNKGETHHLTEKNRALTNILWDLILIL